MHLRNLSLLHFKNFGQAEIEFCPRINCFTGKNGVGKTNLLDAVHYLSLTKSYFNPIDAQNIQHGKEFMVVQGKFDRDGNEESIYCGIKRTQKKQFKRNKKEYQRLADHIGFLPVVMISPADNVLITEGSEERRKFINSVISQYDHEYLEDVVRYNHTLLQRNKLLKDAGNGQALDQDLVEILNEQLAGPGERIFRKRSEFARSLIPVFQKYYSFISYGREQVNVVYQSHLEKYDFRMLLRENLMKDKVLQYTSQGIHKDDLLLTLDGYPIKRIGSQGQQKTLMVALKLAQFDFIRENNGQIPLLLLDDIFDKFDHDRVKQVIHLVAEDHFGQIFVADTNKNRIEAVLAELHSDYRIFSIEDSGAVVISESDEKK
ncbi:MAG: DNA replication and repair protein RecF [Bacteroidales bacterium]